MLCLNFLFSTCPYFVPFSASCRCKTLFLTLKRLVHIFFSLVIIIVALHGSTVVPRCLDRYFNLLRLQTYIPLLYQHCHFSDPGSLFSFLRCRKIHYLDYTFSGIVGNFFLCVFPSGVTFSFLNLSVLIFSIFALGFLAFFILDLRGRKYMLAKFGSRGGKVV